jgi:hypothetical protein
MGAWWPSRSSKPLSARLRVEVCSIRTLSAISLPVVTKIISGGQTGVDRAALDFAIAHGLEHGGWVPKGRLAEDGVIPEQYNLTETESADPARRTERNVLESDATLIVARDRKLFGGTQFTQRCAEKHNKRLLIIYEADDLAGSVADLRTFAKRFSVLNIAGPRESEATGLGLFVSKLLRLSLTDS